MKKLNFARYLFVILALAFCTVIYAQSGIVGIVSDKKDKEPLTGAAILIEGTTNGTTADIDGNYKINGLAAGKYTLVVSYVSYKTQRIPNVVVEKDKLTVLNIGMEDAALQLESVQVVAQRRTDTELSLLKSVRSAVQVVSGVSSQQIGKTLDRDASEVVKRIPGVTIQDNRFIVVRGLNQRYNNVWLNNAATPSSETDVKAFSFDAIPSNMIDNLLIFKTGSPELSAEATGGFIKISTKNIPDENFLNVEYGIAYNDQSTFKDTYSLPGETFDFLGLGSGARNIPSDFPANISLVSIAERDNFALQLKNKWVAQRKMALPNQKASIAFGKKWNLDNGAKLGTITSLNYSNSYSTRNNMQNYMYERLDPTTETPTYEYKYNANVYSNDFKVGLMHNWALQTTNGTRLEFKNIFNQIGVDKTANTEGWNNYRQGNFKYFSNQYSSRTTYSGQLSGNHKFDEQKDAKLDWNTGFAYANRIEPDRQNWSMKENNDGIYQYMLPTVPSINELGRLYMTNNEYVTTAALNYEQKMQVGEILPTIKAGGYAEYKTRDFSERSICYKATNSGLYGDDEINALGFETLFTEPYLGQNKVLSIDEQTNVANSYDASNLLSAGYLAINLPIGSLNIYGGVRAEYNRLTLNGFYNASSPVRVDEPTFNLFPSLNASYNLTEKSLVRLAYARTINRPEFREVSPLGYYDFTEKNSVKGNPNLVDASIQNVDLRFEHYPTPNETFSVAAFYKRFSNPIEMVSVGTGSEYSFENALGATNYGLELEMKKSLESLIGLKNFTLSLNASYIYSMVDFANTQTERSRPLQGQSPMVINTALFYQNDKLGLSTSLMYNVMGKRILVAAQLNQGEVVVPDIYEMPRHVVDFSLNKKIGKKLELKFGIKDLLAQNYVTQQTYEYVKDGVAKSATLTNKVYNLGRTVSLGGSWKF
jgi:TonB-dependent receptor